MPCHVVRGFRCQVDHCSLQVCHMSQSTSRDIWQPALHQGPQTLWVDERGVNNPPGKTSRKKKRKSEGITVEGQEWQRCFIATTLVAKNKPNYPLKKGQWMASLIFTVGLVTALWLAPLRRSPWVWGGVCCYFLIKILFKMYTALKFFN